MELHDDIGQRLSLLNIQLDTFGLELSAAGQDGESQRAAVLRRLADELTTDIHELSHRLYSSKLPQLGLRTALNKLCKLVSEQHQVSVNLKAEGFDTDACYLYLKARYFWNKRTPTAFKQAILHYEEAIATDPEFALAYAGLADCHIVLGTFAFIPMAESFPRGKAAAEKALALDPFLGEAHTSLAVIISIYEHRWHTGEIQFKKSISLRPDYATAHHWYSFCLCAMGRVPEGIAEISKAEELDPLAPIILTNFGTVHYWARQYDRALEQYHKVLSLSPDFWTAHWMMGLAYEQKGSYGDAAEQMRTAMKFFPGTSAVLSASLARVYALSGSPDRALELVSQVKNKDDAAVRCPYHLAMVYASLGQNDAAFEWLDKAFEAHDMWINFLKVDPKMDSLRRSPRYIELLRRVTLPD